MDEGPIKTYSSSYGRCPCTGVYQKRFVEVRLTVAGRSVVLEQTPQGACPQCGSRVYKTNVLRTLEAVMKS